MLEIITKDTLRLTTSPFKGGDNEVIFVMKGIPDKARELIKENLRTIEKLFFMRRLHFRLVDDIPDSYHSGSRCYCGKYKDNIDDSISYLSYHINFDFVNQNNILQQFRTIAMAYSQLESTESYFNNELIDTEAAYMLSQMETCARALKMKGIRTDVIDEMLMALEAPVHMEVNHDYLLFPELGHLRIGLNPMEMALYILVLNHKEGIVRTNMKYYRSEMMNIYSRTTVYGDWETIEATVDSICLNNEILYPNISRIKHKIICAMGEKLGSFYFIKKVDDKYVISLDRNFVEVNM